MSYWAVRQIKKCGNKSPSRIQVLGLSYKQNTDSIKDSAAILTINEFPNFPIFAHDPFVNYSKVTMIQNPLDGLELANALWILTPHDEYRKIKSKDIVEKMAARTSIIDPYGVLDKEFFKDTSYNYYTIG
jgi:UDP-N-acetyl-D-mannosaminuronate dehydrogenase